MGHVIETEESGLGKKVVEAGKAVYNELTGFFDPGGPIKSQVIGPPKILTFPDGIDSGAVPSYMIFGVKKILSRATTLSKISAIASDDLGDQFKARGYDKSFLNVILPIPPSLQINQAIGWENVELGAVAGGAVAAQRKDGALSDILAAGINGIVDATVRTGANVASAMTGVEFGNAKRAITKNIVNPRLEVLFQGINFRTFSFAFKLSPTSREEAIKVRDIVKIFRYHSAPSIPDSSERFIVFPSMFSITFIHNKGLRHPAIPNIGDAVCTGVDVDFTSVGSWAQLEDGTPVETQLTLTFSEIIIPTKERILHEDPDFRYT